VRSGGKKGEGKKGAITEGRFSCSTVGRSSPALAPLIRGGKASPFQVGKITERGRGTASQLEDFLHEGKGA